MPKTDAALTRMREICLALPDTKETMTWGEPHFRVGEKIFAGYGREGGKVVIGFKLERPHAESILDDPRFTRAPYVGHAGWVSMDASRVDDWQEVRALVRESYGLIAPKRSIAKIGDPVALRPNKTRASSAAPPKATKARPTKTQAPSAPAPKATKARPTKTRGSSVAQLKAKKAPAPRTKPVRRGSSR